MTTYSFLRKSFGMCNGDDVKDLRNKNGLITSQISMVETENIEMEIKINEKAKDKNDDNKSEKESKDGQ